MTPTPSEIRIAAKVLRWCAGCEDERRFKLPRLERWWANFNTESTEELRRKSYVLDEIADEIERNPKL